jgi:hypothetical protein
MFSLQFGHVHLHLETLSPILRRSVLVTGRTLSEEEFLCAFWKNSILRISALKELRFSLPKTWSEGKNSQNDILTIFQKMLPVRRGGPRVIIPQVTLWMR